jgi:D-alanyl-D-alanine endopeptidase (penicillin-binding protein 7)
MNFTRFVEPTGLDSGNVSTPGDIAKLVEAAMKHPEIRRLTTTARDAISANTFGPKQERRIEYGNTNKLLGLPGLVGGKTGYLGIGNATFALKFVQGAKSRIVVILGSTDGRTRNEDMKNLALWALSQT